MTTNDTQTTIDRLTERIAALEEQVVRFAAQPVIDYGAPNNTPEECQGHTCSYYRHYLAYGPADLEHEGYHAAERNAATHIEACKVWDRGQTCSLCVTHEQRVRA